MTEEKPHILITGASSGIGAALARLYAAPGVRLSLSGQNEARLKLVCDDCAAKGALVDPAILDVRRAESMDSWVKSCDKIMPLTLAIANAGLSANTSSSHESAVKARLIFDINVMGTLNLVQPLLPLMKARKSGQIAVMSSLASFFGSPYAGAYCASKAAVRLYGQALRAEMKNYNVKVNVICPGFVKTPMTDVNQFPMPFLISAEKAAQRIKRGLEKDERQIAFPLPMAMMVGLMRLFPADLLGRCMTRLPQKAR